MICALVIGREGSRGFPGKNLAPVLGRPLMVYPLLAARHAPSVQRSYLSTDSKRIAEVGASLGARHIIRPPALATPEALGEEVFAHGYRFIRSELVAEGESLELVVLLFCNAPTLLPDQIEEGIRVLRERPELDSAVSVSAYNMWSPLRARKIGKDGLLHPFVPFEAIGDPATLNCDRDSQGDVLFADMSVSVIRPRCLEDLGGGLLPQRWMGRNIYPLLQWGGCDVDFAWQVPGVVYWLEAHGFSNEKTPYEKFVKGPFHEKMSER